MDGLIKYNQLSEYFSYSQKFVVAFREATTFPKMPYRIHIFLFNPKISLWNANNEKDDNEAEKFKKNKRLQL